MKREKKREEVNPGVGGRGRIGQNGHQKRYERDFWGHYLHNLGDVCRVYPGIVYSRFLWCVLPTIRYHIGRGNFDLCRKRPNIEPCPGGPVP